MKRMALGLFAACLSGLSQAAYVSFEFTGVLTSFSDSSSPNPNVKGSPSVGGVVTGRFIQHGALPNGKVVSGGKDASYQDSTRSFLSFQLDGLGFDFTNQTQLVNDRDRYPVQEHADQIRIVNDTPDGIALRDRFTSGNTFGCHVDEMCFDFRLRGPLSGAGLSYLPPDTFTSTEVPTSLGLTNFVGLNGVTPAESYINITYYNGLDGVRRAVDGTISLQSIRVAPVPLPASAWLFLTGLGGLTWVARRRRAAPAD